MYRKIVLDTNALINPIKKLKSLIMYYKFRNKLDFIIPSYIYEEEITYDDTLEFVDQIINDGIVRIAKSAPNNILDKFSLFIAHLSDKIIDMGEVSCFHYVMTLNNDEKKYTVIITDDKDAIKAAKKLKLNTMTLNEFIEYSRDNGNYEIKFANGLLEDLSINI